jgi:beta-lactamase superfamily II metal-dependent hydrolase
VAEAHVLNVGQGDCIILKSNNNRITLFDICGGNISEEKDRVALGLLEKASVLGNFKMCKHPTNPLTFLKNKMGSTSVFRFILSHPDMDHMDGFDNLMDDFTVSNFWDSGVRKDKPDFAGSPYYEEDWDRYVQVRDGNEDDVTIINPKAGARNKYFNQDDDGGGGDFIYIYAPDSNLVNEANSSENSDVINDASYVIVYRTQGGRILLPGDAHDKTWEYVLEHYEDQLKDCECMVAPHHGRDSGRSWDFLDTIKPKFSVLGCASSQHLAYDAWNRRDLEKITQNQAGNVAVYPRNDGLSIYVENDKFVTAYGGDTSIQDNYGNYYLTKVTKSVNY